MAGLGIKRFEMPVEHKFDSREAASEAAADRIAALIGVRLKSEECATFVVSGGSTPHRCFDLLSHKPINWQQVQVVLSDERWVPNDHEDSNERLLRERLLKHAASAASMLPIYREDQSVEERCDSLQTLLPESGFACAMVGMGQDGHFASLFADADSLQNGLNPSGPRFYIPVRTDTSPYARISMTLGALLQSDEVLLLCFGDEKLQVYEQAKAGEKSYPIAHLLQQQNVAVALYWAP